MLGINSVTKLTTPTIKLIVTRIIESKGGYSTVKVCEDAFKAIRFAIAKHFDARNELKGIQMPYKYLGKSDDIGISRFDFNGIAVDYQYFVGDAELGIKGKTCLIMKTTDAEALYVETPDVVLPYNVKDFDINLV